MRQSLASSAVDSVLSNRVHPKTGEPIVPVGFLPNGKPIWPIMGASPDDDSDEDSEVEDVDEDIDDVDEDEDDDGSSEDSGGAGRTRKRTRSERQLFEENKRRRHDNKQLKAELAEVTARLKEFEDKDKGESQLLTESVQELSTENESLKDRLGELALQNAFLSDNSYKWRNPKAALRLADLSSVEIDDDGEVVGLAEALKELAESEPYLLADDEDDEDEIPAAGQAPKTKRKRGIPERDKLVHKYPALRR